MIKDALPSQNLHNTKIPNRHIDENQIIGKAIRNEKIYEIDNNYEDQPEFFNSKPPIVTSNINTYEQESNEVVQDVELVDANENSSFGDSDEFFISYPSIPKPKIKTFTKQNISSDNDVSLEDLNKFKSPIKKRKLSCSNNDELPDALTCKNCLQSEKNLLYYRKKCSEADQKLNTLQLKHKYLKKSYSNLKYKLKKKSNILKTEKASLSKEIDKIKSINVSENAKLFSKTILCSRPKEYSLQQRNLCLNIFYKSSSTYIFLRNRLKLNLPSVSSLRKWMPIKHLQPGFNQPIIDALIEQEKSLSIRSKHCTLLFDAMSIRQELCLDEYADEIVGFQDLGENERKPIIAKEILTFMIRSDFDTWKSVVSYFPSKNAITGTLLKELIYKNLDILSKIGYVVSTITCDQGSSNRNCYKLLNVTKDKPYIIHNNRNVYCTFDICHEIKNARNTVMKYELITPDGTVSWAVPKALHEMDRFHDVKVCPRITDRHIYPNTFEKMNVRLAVQVLSHSCSAGIKTALSKNLFSEKEKKYALPTAKFFETCDELFDCLNSNQIVNFKKPLKSAIQKDNHVYNKLVELKSYFSNVTCPTKVFWIDGIVQTINGTIMLAEDYFKDEKINITYLLTKKKNSDPIENFYGMIRGRNGFNRNPSVREFSITVSKIVSMKHISFTSNLTNCEPDEEQYLLNSLTITKQIPKNDLIADFVPIDESMNETLTSSETSKNFENVERDDDDDDCVEEIDDIDIEVPSDEEVFNIEDAALRYYCGYVVFKVLKLINCEKCKNELIKSEELSTSSELLIYHKNYNKNSQAGLVPPSDNFYKICKVHLMVFSTYVQKNITAKNIKNNIIKLCINSTNKHKTFCNWFSENDEHYQHKLKLLNFFILVLLRKMCLWAIGKNQTNKSGLIRSNKINPNCEKLKILKS